MIQWEARPEVARNLFNPFFCAALLGRTIRGYNDTGMELALAYVALPLILHYETRKSLPKTASTTIAAWRERQPELVYEFAEHASVLRDFVDTALVVGLQNNLFRLDEITSRLRATGNDSREDQILDDRYAEVSSCLERSKFVGRWLARAGSTSTIFALFGMRP